MPPTLPSRLAEPVPLDLGRIERLSEHFFATAISSEGLRLANGSDVREIAKHALAAAIAFELERSDLIEHLDAGNCAASWPTSPTSNDPLS